MPKGNFSSSVKLSLAALLLSSTTALAGGLAPAPHAPAVAVPVQDVTDWTGVYVGVGYSSVSNGGFEYSNGFMFEYLEEEMHSLFIGYNHQFSNNFVVGGELNYSSGLEGLTIFPNEFLDDILSVRLRGGYAFGNLHAYGFVGYAVSGTAFLGHQTSGMLTAKLTVWVSST